ncbi:MULTISPECIES: DEAD/DEAH box helicase [Aminobacterium]|jgi:superfamily II RNA helicase|uniref:DEAD/DEAH box helicase n=1 Tax=Aminobacterium TaxID=81466 RepID=UPI0025806B83|nr:DEAD/DEAH box helicase [Aminobacterium sp. UBA4987]
MERSFYNWQLKAYNKIYEKNSVLSAPTGAGKTLVAYLWAGLLTTEGKTQMPEGISRIIFTAPIKALSNERYMDLRRMGFDVGIETGDFKRNEEAPIICCTQEIYTLKYTKEPHQKLIIDEFHYIFEDPDRARTYIDGIRETAPTTSILVMSATFSQPGVIGRYLETITERSFTVYESQERVTELVYVPKKPAQLFSVHDALVFVFSQRGTMDLAYTIARTRRRLPREQRSRLYELATILDVPKVQMPLLCGVGIYHGSMLPKEKLLVESAFRERILDVVVGTNALALGVNLPAESVIFAQLVQFHDNAPISKNEFLQMAGRAGRKGLFDTGYVTWLSKSPCEHRGYDTGDEFKKLLSIPPEAATVSLRPAWGALLRREVHINEEADYISRFSLPEIDPFILRTELRQGLNRIDRAMRRMVRPQQRKRFRALLANIWYEEMSADENLEMARLFFAEERPEALFAAQLIAPYERNYLQSLLKIKRYANHLPEGYSFKSMQMLNQTVDDIDPTIYGFEEKINEIEGSLKS